jgi:hypothetical protein
MWKTAFFLNNRQQTAQGQCHDVILSRRRSTRSRDGTQRGTTCVRVVRVVKAMLSPLKTIGFAKCGKPNAIS